MENERRTLETTAGPSKEVPTGVIPYRAGHRIHRRAALGSILSAIATGGVAAAYVYLGRDRVSPQIPSTPSPVATATTQPAPASRPPPESVEKIYGEAIIPALARFDGRNAAAVNRAMLVLHDRIAMHHAGVEPFTKDVASWHTRFGVLRRYPSDLWHRLRHQPQVSDGVAIYVNQKFRSHVLSEQSLSGDVSAVLSNFDDGISASQNQLYADLTIPLARIKAARPVTTPAMSQFRENVQQRAAMMTSSLAPDTLVAGLAAIAGGWVATDVAQGITMRIVSQILTQLGTAMAAEGIEAGGATVGGAAAGASGGSFAGPLGTVIGIGVGLIVGAIVDWRLSKRFEAKVSAQCNAFLSNLEDRLRNGSANSPGLERVLTDAATVTGRAQRESIRAALKEFKE